MNRKCAVSPFNWCSIPPEHLYGPDSSSQCFDMEEHLLYVDEQLARSARDNQRISLPPYPNSARQLNIQELLNIVQLLNASYFDFTRTPIVIRLLELLDGDRISWKDLSEGTVPSCFFTGPFRDFFRFTSYVTEEGRDFDTTTCSYMNEEENSDQEFPEHFTVAPEPILRTRNIRPLRARRPVR